MSALCTWQWLKPAVGLSIIIFHKVCLCDSGVCGDNVGVQSLFSKPMTQHKLISVPMTFQLHHCSMTVTGCLLSTNQACVGVHVLDIPVQQSPLGEEKSLSPLFLLFDTMWCIPCCLKGQPHVRPAGVPLCPQPASHVTAGWGSGPL